MDELPDIRLPIAKRVILESFRTQTVNGKPCLVFQMKTYSELSEEPRYLISSTLLSEESMRGMKEMLGKIAEKYPEIFPK